MFVSSIPRVWAVLPCMQIVPSDERRTSIERANCDGAPAAATRPTRAARSIDVSIFPPLRPAAAAEPARRGHCGGVRQVVRRALRRLALRPQGQGKEQGSRRRGRGEPRMHGLPLLHHVPKLGQLRAVRRGGHALHGVPPVLQPARQHARALLPAMRVQGVRLLRKRPRGEGRPHLPGQTAA